MSFFSRFSIFFFGALLGSFVLYVSLKHRTEPISFNYFPNSRIKSHLINSDILIAEELLCKINCVNLDPMSLAQYISDGNIDFKKSEIRGYDVKTYYLFNEINKKGIYYFKFRTNGVVVELIDFFISPIPPDIDNYWLENCQNCF